MCRHSAFTFGAFMTEKRNLKLDLFAIGLLAVVVFLALALLTYNPADPVLELVAPLDRLFQPDVLVHPQNPTVQNACGKWGALLASMLLTGLGIGAYYLVISLGTLDALLLARRVIDAPLVRSSGWCISLIGLTTMAAIVVPNWSPGPIIGSGGYIGALGAGLLEMHFATVGSLILVTSLILGGLLLSTDYALMQVARLVMLLTVSSVAHSRRRVPAGKSSKNGRPKSDLDEEELSIRIGGVTMEEEEDEEADEVEDEEADDEVEWEEEGEEEEAEPADLQPGVVVKAAPASGHREKRGRRVRESEIGVPRVSGNRSCRAWTKPA